MEHTGFERVELQDGGISLFTFFMLYIISMHKICCNKIILS